MHSSLNTELIIVSIGTLIFLSHYFVNVFDKTNIPDVVWLTLIGFFLGPVFGFVHESDFGNVGLVVTKITLVIILFEGGLELELENLKKFTIKAVLLSFLSFILCLVLIWWFLYQFTDFPPINALYCAVILAGPAPSVVIPLLKKIKLSESMKTILSVESTLGEALCILVSLAILESFTHGGSFRVGVLSHFVFSLVISFFMALMMGFVGAYVWSILLGKMRQIQNSFFTTPAFVFIIYGLTEFLGFSGPIAALSFGIVMGNIKSISSELLRGRGFGNLKSHTSSEKRFFSELVFLLKIFFFVYLGLAIQISNWLLFVVGLVITLLILLSRFLSVVLVRPVIGATKEESRNMTLMFHRGLAAAILSTVPASYELARADEIKSVVDYTIILSILLSSILAFCLDRRSRSQA